MTGSVEATLRFAPPGLALLLTLGVGCDDQLLGVPTGDGGGELIYTPDWAGVTAMSEDHCQACHAPGGAAESLPLPEALALDLDAGDGWLVVPFEPDLSLVWRVIGGELEAGDIGDMPLGARLPNHYVDHVRLWILAGAPHPTVPRDDDLDGVTVEDGDCNDLDPNIFPAAEELCDGVDNNCDGVTDGADATGATTWYPDADLDGYGGDAGALGSCEPPAGWLAIGGDCDDAEAAYHPGALELDCRDPNDYNCDGAGLGVDADGDLAWACDDCADADPTVHPGADELCDLVDQDCDGLVDEEAIDAALWYPDLDQDGHGDGGVAPVAACAAPFAGATTTDDDCDDGNAAVFGGAVELCDGFDQDCDGVPDDGAVDQTAWYTDGDGDGYGDDATLVYACAAPGGAVAVGGDCNDGDPAFHPNAPESDCADPADYNCDGLTGAVDNDGDGYVACQECDDTDALIHPLAEEVCDGVDNDCAGGVDVGATDATTWFPDGDGDGYGDDQAVGVSACAAPFLGWRGVGGDCDDADASSNPAGTEVCDGADNDCDGTPDDGALDANAWYADGDGDGEGAGAAVMDCADSMPGSVLNDADCDDGDANVNTAAVEVCDGVDNDCSGLIDDDAVGATRFYADGDGDGYGDVADPGFLACAVSVPGASVDPTDCNDANGAINPGAAEVCDGADNDCSGLPDDDAVDATAWYPDADGDGYGDEVAVALVACTDPGAAWVPDNTDCDDTAATVNPGVLYDFANGVDDNCSGVADEDGAAPSHAADIQPIWNANCTTGCHSGPVPTGGMSLTSANAYNSLVNTPSGQLPAMNRVTPFDPANSYLWHKLNGTQVGVGGSGGQMPANQGGPPGGGGSLPAQELALIEAWILGGANP